MLYLFIMSVQEALLLTAMVGYCLMRVPSEQMLPELHSREKMW
jgi:hypothetical protein